MAKKDIAFLVETPTISIATAAKTASANGAAVDLKDQHGCLMTIETGLWTDGTHTLVLNESSDNSTFTAVAAADLSFVAAGAISSTGTIVIDGLTVDNLAYKIGYAGSLRYLRIESTVTSASTGAVYGGLLIPSHKRNKGKLSS